MENQVTVSEAAFTQIAEILSKNQDKSALRVSVEGGGCSGFSYKFDLVTSEDDDDLVIANENAKVVIDNMSLNFMGGSVIDFVDNLMGRSFQVNNPNAIASCGCGTSFSI